MPAAKASRARRIAEPNDHFSIEAMPQAATKQITANVAKTMNGSPATNPLTRLAFKA